MPTITYIIQDCSRDLSQCTKINKEKKKKLGGGRKHHRTVIHRRYGCTENTPENLQTMGTIRKIICQKEGQHTTMSNNQLGKCNFFLKLSFRMATKTMRSLRYINMYTHYKMLKTFKKKKDLKKNWKSQMWMGRIKILRCQLPLI